MLKVHSCAVNAFLSLSWSTVLVLIFTRIRMRLERLYPLKRTKPLLTYYLYLKALVTSERVLTTPALSHDISCVPARLRLQPSALHANLALLQAHFSDARPCRRIVTRAVRLVASDYVVLFRVLLFIVIPFVTQWKTPPPYPTQQVLRCSLQLQFFASAPHAGPGGAYILHCPVNRPFRVALRISVTLIQLLTVTLTGLAAENGSATQLLPFTLHMFRVFLPRCSKRSMSLSLSPYLSSSLFKAIAFFVGLANIEASLSFARTPLPTVSRFLAAILHAHVTLPHASMSRASLLAVHCVRMKSHNPPSTLPHLLCPVS